MIPAKATTSVRTAALIILCGSLIPSVSSSGPADSKVENITTDLDGSDGYDYNEYSPGPLVKTYSKNEFPANFTDDAGEYLTDSFMAQAVYVALFCFITLLVLVCWSCCGMATPCCGKCCVNPPGWAQGKGAKTALIIIGSLLAVTIFAIAAAGLANEDSQDEEVSKLGSILDVVIDWGESTEAALDVTKVRYATTRSEIDQLGTASKLPSAGGECPYEPISTRIVAQISDINKFLNSSEDAFASSDTDLDTYMGEIRDQRDSIDKAVKDINDNRNKGVTTMYYVVIILMLVQALFMCFKQCKPEMCGTGIVGGLSHCCTCIVLLDLFVLSVIAALLAFIVVVYADFCMIPTQATISLIDLKPADEMYYYLKCRDDASLVNPFNNDTDKAITALDDAIVVAKGISTILDEEVANASALNASFAVQCKNNLEDDVDELTLSMESLQLALGSGSSAAGFEKGLFSKFHCDQLGFRFEAVINQICSKVFDPFARSYEFIFIIVALFFVLEFARRWARPTMEQKHPDAEDASDPKNGYSTNDFKDTDNGASAEAEKKDETGF